MGTEAAPNWTRPARQALPAGARDGAGGRGTTTGTFAKWRRGLGIRRGGGGDGGPGDPEPRRP